VKRRWWLRCVYCGWRFRGTGLACGCHRDLLQLDPYYAQAA